MAIQLPPSALRNPDAPPIQDMIDAIENLTADYVLTWHCLPKYLYMNDRCWDDTMLGLGQTVELYGLEVVTHPDMPYEAAALHHDHLPAREVAMNTARNLGNGLDDLEEAVEQGRIILG
jgi:hypothetical protein